MSLAAYLGLLHAAEQTLADSFRQVAAGHVDEPDVHHTCMQLAGQCDAHVKALAPLVSRYGETEREEQQRLHAQGLSETRTGGVGLLRDLQDLYMLACFVDITWTLVGQAGKGACDRQLVDTVDACEHETAVHLTWLRTRMRQGASHALLVPG